MSPSRESMPQSRWPRCRSAYADGRPGAGCHKELLHGPEGPVFLRRAGDQHEEGFAHHVLAHDQLLGLAALLVEYDGGELLQRLARLVQRAAVRVHPGQLLDEADITMARLEVYRGERKPSLFHWQSCLTHYWNRYTTPRLSTSTSVSTRAPPPILL